MNPLDGINDIIEKSKRDETHNNEIIAWAQGHVYADQYGSTTDALAYSIIVTASAARHAWWRGFFEGIGDVDFHVVGGVEQPTVHLVGAPPALWALMEYVYETNPKFDRCSTQIAQCGGANGRVKLRNTHAQMFIATMYPRGNDYFGLSSMGKAVERIAGWSPLGSRREQTKVEDALVSRALATGMMHGPRVAYQQHRPF